MKKILPLFLLIVSVYQLKAQQFFAVKPVDSTAYNLDKLFKIAPIKPLQLLPPKLNLYQPFNNDLANELASNIDRMPISVLNGYSKMPVIKIGGDYTMPVKKIGSKEVFPFGKSLPNFQRK